MVKRALAEHVGERFIGAALRTHDKEVRGLRADEEPPEREASGAGVERERAERAQLPGVEGGEGRAHAAQHDDEEARMPARRGRFKHRGVGGSWARRLAAGEERDEPGEVGARGRADRAGRARERDRERTAEERFGVSGDEGLEGVGVGEVRE